MCRDRKGETDVHATAIIFYRCIKESLNISKAHNFVKFCLNFLSLHTYYCAIKIDVFTPGQLRMEACTDFQ